MADRQGLHELLDRSAAVAERTGSCDHATYFRHLTDQFGPDTHWRNWSYPPHYLLAIWPLGFFGYGTAMAGFLSLTLVAYLMALRAFVGPITISLAVATAIVLPSVVDNIYHAQNGFLSAALLLGGLALRMERPVLAGVLIGCLTIKPQLGVLLPLLLLIEKRWLVIASASLTTAGQAFDCPGCCSAGKAGTAT